jgi:hypothetical protein
MLLITGSEISSTFKFENTLIDFQSNNNVHGEMDVLTPTQFSYLGNICVREVNLRGNHISIIETGSFSAMKYIDCIETLTER